MCQRLCNRVYRRRGAITLETSSRGRHTTRVGFTSRTVLNSNAGAVMQQWSVSLTHAARHGLGANAARRGIHAVWHAGRDGVSLSTNHRSCVFSRVYMNKFTHTTSCWISWTTHSWPTNQTTRCSCNRTITHDCTLATFEVMCFFISGIISLSICLAKVDQQNNFKGKQILLGKGG